MLEGWLWVVAGIGVIVAGISKGGFGSGIGFASSAILALAMEPAMALAIMLPLLFLIDCAALRPFWGRWHGPSMRVLLWGGVPGAGLGVLLFSVISADALRLIIGIVSLAFPAIQLARARGWLNPEPRPFSPFWGVIAGLVGGFTSFVSHAGGPAVAIFMLAQKDMEKTLYQATTVIVFWAINVLKVAGYAYLGLFSWEMMGDVLILVPLALLGTWLGVVAHHAINERAFFAISYVALCLTGVKLIYDALS